MNILSEATKQAIGELQEWADSPKKIKFLRLAKEWFDPVSLVLIVRAIKKSKLLDGKKR